MKQHSFYDIYFLFRNGFAFNQKIIRERTGKDTVDYLEYLKSFVQKNINSRNILMGLGELLNEKQKDWVKSELKKELIAQIDFWIDEVRKTAD